jgi:hypothetical protein
MKIRPAIIFLMIVLLASLGMTPSPALTGHPAASLTGESPNRGVELALTSRGASPGWEIAYEDQALYPQDIDPPESCGIPSLLTYGQDVEIMLAPWDEPASLLALNQAPAWKEKQAVSGGTSPYQDPVVISLSTEQLLAAWADGYGRIQSSTWGAGAGWTTPTKLSDDAISGRPALISRSPVHWAVFARFNNEIKVREKYMSNPLTDWQHLGSVGIADAASDPVVVSKDAGHMGLFYRATDGTVKFSEWDGAWLTTPVSLGRPADGTTIRTITSELNAVSRTGSHLAVYGVDTNNQLWYRERLDRQASDWSDSPWVKLLVNVALEKPAVVSRHANHIGVAVRDQTSARPYYTSWSYLPLENIYLPVVVSRNLASSQSAPQFEPQAALSSPVTGVSGWSEPAQISSLAFTSPLSLAPRGLDSLAVSGITDGSLYQILWIEAGGWSPAAQLAGAGEMAPGQVGAGVMRRLDDLMLLGRNGDGQLWFKHFTSLDQMLSDTPLSSSTAGLPRAQALAVVEGRWLWVSAVQTESGGWHVQARETTTGISASLELSHSDSGQSSNRVALAAGDLDLDGSSEVVVATINAGRTRIDISVLELGFSDASTLVISAAPKYEWLDLNSAEDVSLAVGDLDGDQQRDDLVVAFRGLSSIHYRVFGYQEPGQFFTQGLPGQHPLKDWCFGVANCSVIQRDLEIAAGSVKPGSPSEQLVLLVVAGVLKDGQTYVRDQLEVLTKDPNSWSFEPEGPGCSQVGDFSLLSAYAGSPYSSAVAVGDMSADGVGNIAYAFADRLAVLSDPLDCTYRVQTGLPDTLHSLAIGDVDLDGRGEAIVGSMGASTRISYFEIVEDGQLRRSGERSFSGGYSVLVGDLDNDTQLAELAGCKTFSEINVVAVVNGAPRWYDQNEPIQDAGGVYGRSDTDGGTTSTGTSTSNGFSVTIGLKHTFNVPVTAIKIGEVRASASREYIWSTGESTTDSNATTKDAGYEYAGTSRGMVVYNAFWFTCYYYNVYPPSQPENSSRAMLCQALDAGMDPQATNPVENFMSLEQWHSLSFKQSAGPSWVDVGHRAPNGVYTNDLAVPGNYKTSLPVDRSKLKYLWTDAPITISYDSQGGFGYYWLITNMTGGETSTTTNLEKTGTASAGADIWAITIDAAYIHGRTDETTGTTSWEDSYQLGGSVAKFMDPNRLCYSIVPYYYKARAVSQAGAAVDYLEMDYYVPTPPFPCARSADDINE